MKIVWLTIAVAVAGSLAVLAMAWLARRAFGPEFCEACGERSDAITTVTQWTPGRYEGKTVMRLCPACIARCAHVAGLNRRDP